MREKKNEPIRTFSLFTFPFYFPHLTPINQKVYNIHHQMTHQADNSSTQSLFPCIRDGAKAYRGAEGVALLSSNDEMSCFSYGGRNIRFRTSPRLTRYQEVLTWDKGFIEVLAQYGKKIEEEYIDLVSILENLYIDPEAYLASIKKVEVSYDREMYLRWSEISDEGFFGSK